MSWLVTLAFCGLFLISLVFFLIGSRAILFHFCCAVILAGFVLWTGRTLEPESLGEWMTLTTGLILYWFGLTIVRIMLTRSVSLNLLSNFAQGSHSITATTGISSRLKDMSNFGLLSVNQDRCKLTPFGRAISMVVAASYRTLRIK